MMMLRFASRSYEAVCFLLTNPTKNPKWSDHFVLLVPPANRQLLDLLFTLVYMLEDFPSRSLDYEFAGYRQVREEYDRLYERFGSDPKWDERLAGLRETIQTFENYLPLSPEQKAEPQRMIHYWPAPFRPKRKVTSSKPFLEFLDKWLYDETSAQAHLNAKGLIAVGLFVLSNVAPEEMKQEIDQRAIRQYTYVQFTRTLTTVLAIASEIEHFCRLGNREPVARIWGLLSGFVDEAKDVYDQRYQAIFN
jgi:hypothetical protein